MSDVLRLSRMVRVVVASGHEGWAAMAASLLRAMMCFCLTFFPYIDVSMLPVMMCVLPSQLSSDA
ncbi:MAG: hypothetical protein ACT6RN_28025, partial [Agrobacterium sp.]|uniref:hypothetical protein n=1 Tax=Agrobacterium sp. TaxID=361 RepID=UPI00403765D3